MNESLTVSNCASWQAGRGTSSTHRAVLDEAVGEQRRVSVEEHEIFIDQLGDAAYGER
jgi:hypothetical protein